MPINFHRDAKPAFDAAQEITRDGATPILELLSEGFQITWFRESSSNVWLAIVKPSAAVANHFGLRQECFVIGNGYSSDFHQRTLNLSPPANLLERLDGTVRIVASDAPIADAFCAAWAQRNRSTIVLIRLQELETAPPAKERLYSLLSSSLWRRDFFAEAEPVRDPSEFFGRQLVVNELLAKVINGAPVAVFGLRKIGKSSLLGRLEDLLADDDSAITATAFLRGNTTSLTAGRWWHLAQVLVQTWQSKLQQLAKGLESKVHAKADKLTSLISRRTSDERLLADAFEKDITSLIKSARALKSATGRESVRLVCSGQPIPDSGLSFSSATAGGSPSLN